MEEPTVVNGNSATGAQMSPNVSTTSSPCEEKDEPVVIVSSDSAEIGGDQQCPICLSPALEVATRIDGCRHTFCKACITEWVKLAPKCPMCKSVVSYLEFEKDGEPTKKTVAEINAEVEAARIASTSNDTPLDAERAAIQEHRRKARSALSRLVDQNPTGRAYAEAVDDFNSINALSNDLPNLTRAELMGDMRFRRIIYAENLQWSALSRPSTSTAFRPSTAAQNPEAVFKRVVPWVRRDLKIVCSNLKWNGESGVRYICNNLQNYQVNMPQFSMCLQQMGIRVPYLEQFCNNLYEFCASGLDLRAHDANSQFSMRPTALPLSRGGRASSSSTNEEVVVADDLQDSDSDDEDVVRQIYNHRACIIPRVVTNRWDPRANRYSTRRDAAAGTSRGQQAAHGQRQLTESNLAALLNFHIAHRFDPSRMNPSSRSMSSAYTPVLPNSPQRPRASHDVVTLDDESDNNIMELGPSGLGTWTEIAGPPNSSTTRGAELSVPWLDEAYRAAGRTRNGRTRHARSDVPSTSSRSSRDERSRRREQLKNSLRQDLQGFERAQALKRRSGAEGSGGSRFKRARSSSQKDDERSHSDRKHFMGVRLSSKKNRLDNLHARFEDATDAKGVKSVLGDIRGLRKRLGELEVMAEKKMRELSSNDGGEPMTSSAAMTSSPAPALSSHASSTLPSTSTSWVESKDETQSGDCVMKDGNAKDAVHSEATHSSHHNGTDDVAVEVTEEKRETEDEVRAKDDVRVDQRDAVAGPSILDPDESVMVIDV